MKTLMSYELYVNGVYVITIEAKRNNVKIYMVRTETPYAFVVRTDGESYHCFLRNGRLFMSKA